MLETTSPTHIAGVDKMKTGIARSQERGLSIKVGDAADTTQGTDEKATLLPAKIGGL